MPDPAPSRVHNVYRRLSSEQIAQLVAEFEAGTRVATLMRAYGLGKGTVLGILDDHDVQMRNQGLAPEHLGEAKARYQAGESLARLGDRFGCDPGVIRRNLAEAGVTMQPRNGWTARSTAL